MEHALGRYPAMAYRIWSEEQQTEAATGEDVIVVFDSATGQKALVDERLRAAIHALEATGRAAPERRAAVAASE